MKKGERWGVFETMVAGADLSLGEDSNLAYKLSSLMGRTEGRNWNLQCPSLATPSPVDIKEVRKALL